MRREGSHCSHGLDRGPGRRPGAHAAFPGKNGLIAFQKSKGGLYKDIYVMKPNGKAQKDITNTPNVTETDPSFSPNGRKLVFLWTTADYKHSGLGVINADGTGMKRIVSGTYDKAFLSPSWSKDGKSIVYTRFQGTDPPSHVYMVGANGGSQRQLTPRRATVRVPRGRLGAADRALRQ